MSENTPKYTVEDGKILRSSDGKHVADIIDGEVKPTAPAYYKIIDELEAVAKDEGVEPEVTTSIGSPDDAPGTGEPAVSLVIPDKPEGKPETPPQKNPDEALAGALCTVFSNKRASGLADQHSEMWLAIAAEARHQIGKERRTFQPIGNANMDFRHAPKCDPMLGDKTPEFVEWLRENHPDEAERRYGKEDA